MLAQEFSAHFIWKSLLLTKLKPHPGTAGVRALSSSGNPYYFDTLSPQPRTTCLLPLYIFHQQRGASLSSWV